MRLVIRIGLAVLVVAGMGIVVGSSGFTSTQADRAASVTIVEDEDAYVGLSYDPEVTVDQTHASVELNDNITEFTARYENASMVSNQFLEEVTVTVAVVEREETAPETRFELNEERSSGAVEARSAANEAFVPVGATAIFDAEVTCDLVEDDSGQLTTEPRSGNVTVEYRAEGASVTATIERQVTITCGESLG